MATSSLRLKVESRQPLFVMDPQKLSAQELVQLCLASQDPALWYEFERRFQRLISGVIRRRLRRSSIDDPALVDDLTQDTFLKLCDHEYRVLRQFHFEHENSLFGFLKTVAANLVQDYLRKQYSSIHGGGLQEEDLDKVGAMIPARTSFAEDTHVQIVISEIQRCLEKELADEPNFYRDIAIFWLYYRYGLTAKAISKVASFGLGTKGVESTLLRLTRLVRTSCGGDPNRKSAYGGQ